jgi:hypothetical protein
LHQESPEGQGHCPGDPPTTVPAGGRQGPCLAPGEGCNESNYFFHLLHIEQVMSLKFLE